MIFPTSSPNTTFWGCRPRVLWSPNLNSVEILYNTPTLQVSSSYVYSFGSYRVGKKNKHTQTDAAENIQRSSLRYDVG